MRRRDCTVERPGRLSGAARLIELSVAAPHIGVAGGKFAGRKIYRKERIERLGFGDVGVCWKMDLGDAKARAVVANCVGFEFALALKRIDQRLRLNAVMRSVGEYDEFRNRT